MPVRTLVSSLIIATAVAVPAAATPLPPGVVRVDSGWLRGAVTTDHVTYSDIPYAAPPVGERRWRPPAPPRPWTGIRDATAPSTPCPQSRRGPEVVGAEDCLTVDVTVPDDVRPGERLPVLVWLYGGGFVSGAAHDFDGTRLATAGRLMVVTVNYRIGALGFLAAPALDGGGNYGLMDQAAALRWVASNAAAFGGDPHNVTLAGQSAGARSVCAQLASPLARGLFHRAITQSGACDNAVPTLAQAREFGVRATEALGCATAACLRELPPARLVEALRGVGMAVNSRTTDRPWSPVAGTAVLPRQPGDALRDGSATRVPLLVGGTADEMRGFMSNHAALTEAEYRTMVTETFGDEADVVLAEYPAADYGGPALALSAVLGDWGGSIGACPVVRTAEAAAVRVPVYAYEFTEDGGRDPAGFPMGAYHGLELPYLWDLRVQHPYPPLNPEQQRLSTTMIGYWSAFARTGDPNGPNRPHWPAYGARGTVVELSAGGIAPTPYAADHRCDFWAGLPR